MRGCLALACDDMYALADRQMLLLVGCLLSGMPWWLRAWCVAFGRLYTILVLCCA